MFAATAVSSDAAISIATSAAAVVEAFLCLCVTAVELARGARTFFGALAGVAVAASGAGETGLSAIFFLVMKCGVSFEKLNFNLTRCSLQIDEKCLMDPISAAALSADLHERAYNHSSWHRYNEAPRNMMSSSSAPP